MDHQCRATEGCCSSHKARVSQCASHAPPQDPPPRREQAWVGAKTAQAGRAESSGYRFPFLSNDLSQGQGTISLYPLVLARAPTLWAGKLVQDEIGKDPASLPHHTLLMFRTRPGDGAAVRIPCLNTAGMGCVPLRPGTVGARACGGPSKHDSNRLQVVEPFSRTQAGSRWPGNFMSQRGARSRW